MRKTKSDRIEIRLTEDEASIFRRCARLADESVSEILRRFIRRYIRRKAGRDV